MLHSRSSLTFTSRVSRLTSPHPAEETLKKQMRIQITAGRFSCLPTWRDVSSKQSINFACCGIGSLATVPNRAEPVRVLGSNICVNQSP